MARPSSLRKRGHGNAYERTGVRPGDRLRLVRGFVVRDHKGQPMGKCHRRGELWTVLYDACRNHDAILLAEPDGNLHTWDDTLLETFSVIARAPTKGTRVRLRALPTWVRGLPQESKEAFRYCLHHPSRVLGVDDNGLIELVLGRAADRRLGGIMNSIRTEAEFLTTKRSAEGQPNTAHQRTRRKKSKLRGSKGVRR